MTYKNDWIIRHTLLIAALASATVTVQARQRIADRVWSDLPA
nr:hypothetical protein [Paramuribaculum intestinale]